VYVDPETGKEDPEKKGICSNFLCDAQPGDKVQITGMSFSAWSYPVQKVCNRGSYYHNSDPKLRAVDRHLARPMRAQRSLSCVLSSSFDS
jgi:hypothetical protein